MNLSKDKVTEIFYFADNFCKEFHKSIEAHAIEESGKARREPRRKPKMSSGEVITIMLLFHYCAFRNLKHFCLDYAADKTAAPMAVASPYLYSPATIQNRTRVTRFTLFRGLQRPQENKCR
jgi:hypothetical protein